MWFCSHSWEKNSNVERLCDSPEQVQSEDWEEVGLGQGREARHAEAGGAPGKLLGRAPGDRRPFPWSCGLRRLFSSSRAVGAENASWHPGNVDCFGKLVEIWCWCANYIYSARSRQTHTKCPRTTILPHTAMSQAKVSPGQKEHRLLIHKLAAQ